MKKYSHIFETAHVLHDLKGKSVRAGFYTMAAEVVSQILRVGSVVVLARLLLPEHFGLVSMVTAITVFAERFKHLGLSTATIQQKDITHEQVSTLFWINAGAGILIALAIAGLSQGIASFYTEPNLVPITMALSLSFVFGGLNVQHEALLRRQMRFRALGFIQVLATLVSIWLAIELALNGFTYWALVWREVVKSAVELIGVWFACRWWPGLPAPRSGIGSLLRVGRNIVSVDTVYFMCRNIDQILLGRFAGAHALGLYRQAFQLMALPMSQLCQPVGSVTLPSMSALQDQPDRYRRYFEKIVGLLFFVAVPLVAYMAIFSEDIVKVVLGEAWLEAAWIFRILAVGALIEPLFHLCGMVMITQRRTDHLLKWVIMYGISLILGFSIGIQWGAIGVAVGYTVAHYALIVPSLWISFKGTPVSIYLFLKTIFKPVLFSLIMAVFLMALANGIEPLDIAWRIGLSAFTAVFVYFGLWMVYPSDRKRLLDDASSLLSAFKPAESASK
ncbi:MAG: lipopolysaccharide biosynthesis protein [Nitrospirota bacterium]|nr:lipopolysaccharide biosynthesis protein [Nitrospirota bacterium]